MGCVVLVAEVGSGHVLHHGWDRMYSRWAFPYRIDSKQYSTVIIITKNQSANIDSEDQSRHHLSWY